MTPRQTLEFLTANTCADHILWRDPDGSHYLLSRPGAERRYFQEGYIRFGAVRKIRGLLHEIEAEGVAHGSPLWVLMEDVNRENGRRRMENEL